MNLLQHEMSLMGSMEKSNEVGGSIKIKTIRKKQETKLKNIDNCNSESIGIKILINY